MGTSYQLADAIQGAVVCICSAIWLATACYWVWDAWTGRRETRRIRREQLCANKQTTLRPQPGTSTNSNYVN